MDRITIKVSRRDALITAGWVMVPYGLVGLAATFAGVVVGGWSALSILGLALLVGTADAGVGHLRRRGNFVEMDGGTVRLWSRGSIVGQFGRPPDPQIEVMGELPRGLVNWISPALGSYGAIAIAATPRAEVEILIRTRTQAARFQGRLDVALAETSQ